MTQKPGTKRIVYEFGEDQNAEINRLIDRLEPLGFNRQGFRASLSRKGLELAIQYYTNMAEQLEKEQGAAAKRK